MSEREKTGAVKPQPVTHNGVNYRTLKDLAKAMTVPYDTLKVRWGRGYRGEELIKGRPRGVPVKVNDHVHPNIMRVAEDTGIHHTTLRHRRARGKKDDELLQYSHTKPIRLWGIDFPSRVAAAHYGGIHVTTLRRKLKEGVSEDDLVISRPKSHYRNVSVNDIDFPSIQAAARHFGVGYTFLYEKLRGVTRGSSKGKQLKKITLSPKEIELGKGRR